MSLDVVKGSRRRGTTHFCMNCLRPLPSPIRAQSSGMAMPVRGRDTCAWLFALLLLLQSTFVRAQSCELWAGTHLFCLLVPMPRVALQHLVSSVVQRRCLIPHLWLVILIACWFDDHVAPTIPGSGSSFLAGLQSLGGIPFDRSLTRLKLNIYAGDPPECEPHLSSQTIYLFDGFDQTRTADLIRNLTANLELVSANPLGSSCGTKSMPFVCRNAFPLCVAMNDSTGTEGRQAHSSSFVVFLTPLQFQSGSLNAGAPARR